MHVFGVQGSKLSSVKFDVHLHLPIRPELDCAFRIQSFASRLTFCYLF